MSEQVKQDSQKTVVAFVAGLLIGGLLVYVFASPGHDDKKVMDGDESPITVEIDEDQNTQETPTTNNPTDTAPAGDETKKPAMQTGAGKLTVANQAAGTVVTITSATFPSDEGWIGVRDYENDTLGRILGVARFSNEQGLIPNSVELQRATEAGKKYALVFYTESGDRVFNLADDKQNGDIVATFSAQ